MIGKVVAVPTWRPRGELPVVCQSDSGTGNEKPVAVVDTRVYEPTYQSMTSVHSEGLMNDLQLSELGETDTRDVFDVPRQRHPTVDEDSQIADTVNGSKVEVRHPHPGTTAMMQMTAGA